MLHSERGNSLSRAASHSTTTKYIRTRYKEVRKTVMGSRDSSSVQIEISDGNPESFAGFRVIFCKMGTRMKRTALGAYPPHAFLLSLPPSRRIWSIGSVETMI